MEGFAEALAEVIAAIAIAITVVVAAIVWWFVKGFWFFLYYLFHPHPEFADHLL